MGVGRNMGKFFKYQNTFLQGSPNKITPLQDNQIFCLEMEEN